MADEKMRQAHRAYIKAAVTAGGFSSASAMARAMGAEPSTLTRPLQPGWKGRLRDATIRKIWKTSGLEPPPEMKVGPDRPAALAPKLGYDEHLMRDILEFTAEVAQAMGEKISRKELARIAATAYKINLGQNVPAEFVKKQLITMAQDAAEDLEK